MKSVKHKTKSDYGVQKLTANLWVLLAIAMVSAILVPYLLSTDANMMARYSLKKYHEGNLCPEDVKATATFEFIDIDKTNEMKLEARNKIRPIFSRSLNATLASTRRMQNFADAWNEPQTATGTIYQMLGKESLNDSLQVVERYAELPQEERKQLLSAASETMQLVLDMGLCRQTDISSIQNENYATFSIEGNNDVFVAKDMVTKDSLERNLSDWLNSYTISIKGFQLVLLEDTIRLLASENILYNENATTLARNRAENSTSPVYVIVQKGEKILTKDSVITKTQLTLLEEMAKHRTLYTIPEIIGRIVYVMIITFSVMVTFLTFIPHSPRRYEYLKMVFCAIIVCQIICYFLYRWGQASPYDFQDALVPYIIPSLFIARISGKKRLGAVTSFLMGSYALLLPGLGQMSFFSCLCVANICIYFLQSTSRKVKSLSHWLYACIISLFTEMCIAMIGGNSIASLLPVMGALIANITISSLLVYLVISLLESILNLPTESRLRELAYGESPVLERLAATAQGTYNHSMAVSELSYEAAKAIGANDLLARVGGMYHDIGKSEYPEYFVENQGDENKQDDIKPSLSVAIIKSHVKTGIEKGREAGLPQEVLDIIAQHHGNDVIAYFYRKAQDQAGDNAYAVEKSDYCYDGTIPQTKEAAIVMIADSVEAASRTIMNPSSARYEKLVDSITVSKIERQQLEESQLSLNDLHTIKNTLVKSLIGRNHHRIEYPSAKQEQKNDVKAEGEDKENE